MVINFVLYNTTTSTLLNNRISNMYMKRKASSKISPAILIRFILIISLSLYFVSSSLHRLFVSFRRTPFFRFLTIRMTVTPVSRENRKGLPSVPAARSEVNSKKGRDEVF